MGGSAPRAPGDSVRPRRLAGLGARPLNFAVRSHLGTSGFAKKMGKPFVWLFGYIGRSRLARSGGVFGQRNPVRVRLAAASIEVGARALIGFVKQQSRLVRCAPGAEWFRYSLWGALNRETMSPWLAAVGPHAHSGDLRGDF